MSVIDYINNKVIDSMKNFEDLESITIEPKQYKKLMNEVQELSSVNMTGNFSKKITIHSMNGPIEIKIGEMNKQDPNDIFKEIL